MFTNGDSLSSSEDEITTAALREACDGNFLPDSLFSKKDSSIASSHDTQPEINEEVKPSLRITDRSDGFETFGISQTFKDFVAKKLDEKLERNIELHNGSSGDEEVPKKKRKKKKKMQRDNLEVGIKLLSSSHEPIVNVETPKVEGQKQSRKLSQFSRESEADNAAKCKGVAVDPDWILSKTETKAWNERQKGNVFKYKKGRNGILTEQQ